jgi:hypothetical protein
VENILEETSNKYYVYSHIDNKGKCFYIGKGSGRRAYVKGARAEAWNKIGKKGFTPIILISNLSEDKAYELEWRFGEQIGWENLVNQRIEEGCGKRKGSFKQEVRDRISAAHKGLKKPQTKAHSKLISKNKKGKKLSKESCENISKALMGRNKDGKLWDTRPNKTPHLYGKRVAQYTMDWEFIKEWPSIGLANKTLKCDVSGYLSGNQKSAGGSRWKRIDKANKSKYNPK